MERQLLEPGYFSKTWTGRFLIGIMTVGSIVALVLILLDLNTKAQKQDKPVQKRELTKMPNGDLVIAINEGPITAVRFDVCQVIECPRNWELTYSDYEKYMCATATWSSWSEVWWTTDLDCYLTSSAQVPQQKRRLAHRLRLYKLSPRGRALTNCY